MSKGAAVTGGARIERVTMHTGPLSENEARELAQQVAEMIAEMPLAPAGAIRVDIQRPENGGIGSLRDAVAHAVEAALAARAPESGTTGQTGGAR